MTEIIYVGPAHSVWVPVLDAVVLAGEPVAVMDDEVAASLLDQPANWSRVSKPGGTKKAAPAT